MKNIKNYIFILLLSSFSFYLMQKTINYIKDKDNIMLSIKNVEDKYFQYPTEPVIKDNAIIPGLNGLKVNVNKSYNKLKRVGNFNNQLLIYDEVKVNNKLANNKDKFIIKGNSKKNMVSILLYLDDINKIGNYDVPLNYIVSYSFFIDNYSKLKELIDYGSNILIYDISKNNINNLSIKLNKTKQINKYCFNELMNNSFKDLCTNNNYYSINTDIIKNNYLVNIKKEVSSGKLIVLKGNYQNELNIIISFIKSKGYTITNLDNHLNESM